MWYIWQRKLCCSHESFKASIKIWINTKRSAYSNSIQCIEQLNEWLKPQIDMNTKLRTEAKNDFEKDFFKLINDAVFGKTMENVRKHRDIKLVTADERRNQLVSEPNYHITKYFSEDLSANEMKRTKVKMNKSVYLGFSILVKH